jgi:hypothetical protein
LKVTDSHGSENAKYLTITIYSDTFPIAASATSGGNIYPGGTTMVYRGNDQAYTITANSGYHIADVLVDGSSVGAVASYTFYNVITPHAIHASFAQNPSVTITASAGPGGNISPSGSVSVVMGTNQIFRMTPLTGYWVTNVVVDGVSQGPMSEYTFNNVQTDHTISVSFGPTITASAGSGGRVLPSGTAYLEVGADKTYTITANSGYHIADVLVDGSSVGAVGTYAFTNVTAPHTITASFAQNTSVIITASAGPGGNISPSGSVSVVMGTNQIFRFTPLTGYWVTNVVVDGVSQGPMSEYTFNNVQTDHTISVGFGPTITASAGSGGRVLPSGMAYLEVGADKTYTITANSGYHIADVLVDGSSVGAMSSYTFYNVTAPHTITASFAQNTSVTITASAGPGGNISPSGSVSVVKGTKQIFRMTPLTGYWVTNVVVDGVSRGPMSEYTFNNVQTDHTISVSFGPTITASAGSGGNISPSGMAYLAVGADKTYTITANSGYHIADVLVDGSSVGAVASYTFTNVTAPHTISASFAQNTVIITASAGPGGSILPSGNVSVVVGADQGFTIAANNGYHIADVLVDGGSVGPVAAYIFRNVTTPHSISASFAQNAPETVLITATAGAGGSIEPAGSVSVAMGANQSFSITSDPGYWIMDVRVDDVSIGAKSRYNFSNVQGAHTISVSFGPMITASSSSGGSISPSGTSDLSIGGGQTYTINANKKFHIADVLVDGSSVGAVDSYTFSDVTVPHTIAATFSR